MKPKLIPGVPKHIKGSFHDTENTRFFQDAESAFESFKVLKDRFLTINYWLDYADDLGADFKLYDKQGNLKKTLPEIGDFIRIDIPGPGSREGEGFDWVEIIDFQHNQSENNEILEQLLLKAQPSVKPGKSNKKIAHFYHAEASSTFIISRGIDYIKFGIYGRNESPNFDAELLDTLRNFWIAFGGMFGLSKIQWKHLVDKLVDF